MNKLARALVKDIKSRVEKLDRLVEGGDPCELGSFSHQIDNLMLNLIELSELVGEKQWTRTKTSTLIHTSTYQLSETAEAILSSGKLST